MENAFNTNVVTIRLLSYGRDEDYRENYKYYCTTSYLIARDCISTYKKLLSTIKDTLGLSETPPTTIEFYTYHTDGNPYILPSHYDKLFENLNVKSISLCFTRPGDFQSPFSVLLSSTCNPEIRDTMDIDDLAEKLYKAAVAADTARNGREESDKDVVVVPTK